MPTYRFAVYAHTYDDQSTLAKRAFVVLRDTELDVIVAWTDCHKYIIPKRIRRIDTVNKKRFFIIAKLLNYCFFDEYSISNMQQITSDMVKSFLRDYSRCALPDDTDTTNRTATTIALATSYVMDFCQNFCRENNGAKLKISDLYTDVDQYSRRVHRIIKKRALAFELTVQSPADQRPLLRDMPLSIFHVIFNVVIEKHRDLLMLVALCAFAGLRPSEACNVRRPDSPLGPGIRFKMSNGEITDVDIDLTNKTRLRSDSVDVGGIKKLRIQRVYPGFLKVFLQCYELYMQWIAGRPYETAYGPLTVNQSGKALTYPAFATRFKAVIEDAVHILETSEDYEQAMYAHSLKDSRFGMHVFRHFYSTRIALDGATITQLMYWRGDKSPESSQVYLQNKGDLEKQLESVSTKALEYQLWKAGKKYADQ